MKEQPRRAIESALYELGVVTDILGVIATANIAADKAICGTYIDYLAARQREQHDRIERALSCMGSA